MNHAVLFVSDDKEPRIEIYVALAATGGSLFVVVTAILVITCALYRFVNKLKIDLFSF